MTPNHTHSLASFQWSELSDQRALHLTECCLQVQKWCPYKGRGVIPEPVCASKVRNGPAGADQGFSTASQGSCHVHGTPSWNPPTSPYLTFLLAQNLSSKRIAPTDNMRPKSDDAIWHHWLLKWRMTMTFKLLEKQRVQNRFASYEKYIGHFFYKSKLTVALRAKPL